MQEIGELLKRTREQKGLTLHDVQVATKIRTRYLEALERGDDSVVPGEVYFRGFLRSYANFLGLDGLQLVKQYREHKEAQEVPPEAPAELQPAASPRSKATPARRRVNPPRGRTTPAGRGGHPVLAAVIVLLVLAVCLAAWWAWQSGLLLSMSRPPRSVPGGQDDTVPGGVPGGGTAPGPGNTTEPGTQPGVSPGGGQVTLEKKVERVGSLTKVGLMAGGATTLEVTASFQGRCWVRVTADGRTRQEGTFVRGQTASWSAQERLVLRAGNGGAIRLTVNGIDAGTLAGEGEVLDVTIQPVP